MVQYHYESIVLSYSTITYCTVSQISTYIPICWSKKNRWNGELIINQQPFSSHSFFAPSLPTFSKISSRPAARRRYSENQSYNLRPAVTREATGDGGSLQRRQGKHVLLEIPQFISELKLEPCWKGSKTHGFSMGFPVESSRAPHQSKNSPTNGSVVIS